METLIVKLLGYLLTPIYLVVFGLLLVVFHPIQMICRNIGGYSAHKKSVDIHKFPDHQKPVHLRDKHIVQGF